MDQETTTLFWIHESGETLFRTNDPSLYPKTDDLGEKVVTRTGPDRSIDLSQEWLDDSIRFTLLAAERYLQEHKTSAGEDTWYHVFLKRKLLNYEIVVDVYEG